MNDSHRRSAVNLDLPATNASLGLMRACLRAFLEGVYDERTEFAERTPFAMDQPEANGVCGANSVRSTTIYNLQLALHEALTNIIEHAYADQAGRIEVSLWLAQETPKAPLRLIIELHDHGKAFDPENVPAPDLEHPQESGYGLFLMRAILDEVHYHSEPGSNHWKLVKSLSDGESV